MGRLVARKCEFFYDEPEFDEQKAAILKYILVEIASVGSGM